jgi:hypothetical protein
MNETPAPRIEDPRPARQTENYNWPVPGDEDPAQLVSQFGNALDGVDLTIYEQLAALREEVQTLRDITTTLKDSGSNYTAFTAYPANTWHIPHATRPTAVVLMIVGGAGGGGASIFIPGDRVVIVPTIGLAGGDSRAYLSFDSPPGGRWQWAQYGGSPAGQVQAAYRVR